METFTKYDPITLDLKRVESLHDLMRMCNVLQVRIHSVQFYMNGFRVTFENWEGDAILHDGSYGRNSYDWETIGFPWDGDDISVHSPAELASLLYDYKNGEYKDGNQK